MTMFNIMMQKSYIYVLIIILQFKLLIWLLL